MDYPHCQSNARYVFAFPAAVCRRRLTGTKLCCLVTEYTYKYNLLDGIATFCYIRLHYTMKHTCNKLGSFANNYGVSRRDVIISRISIRFVGHRLWSWVGSIHGLGWVGFGCVKFQQPLKFVCWIGVLWWLRLCFILLNSVITYLLSALTHCIQHSAAFCQLMTVLYCYSIVSYMQYSFGVFLRNLIKVSLRVWWWVRLWLVSWAVGWVGLDFVNWTHEHVWSDG